MSTLARVRYQVGRYGLYIAVGLALLGLLAVGTAANSYLNPPVEEFPPEETNVQQFQSSLETEATVVQSSPLYEEGEVLVDQPVYFRELTPEVEFTVVSAAPPGEQVTIEHRLVARSEASFEDRPFWEDSRTVLAGNGTTTGGEVTSRARFNVSAFATDLARVDDSTRGVGAVSTQLVLETTYESPTYEGQLVDTTALQIDGRSYWFGDLAASETRSQTVQPEPREQSPDVRSVAGIAGLGVGLVVAGLAVGVWGRRYADISRLEQEVHHRKYSEWISDGTLPTEPSDRHIYVSSLEDLVDIGIDTGKRVIHDPDIEAYAVVDNEVLYYYSSDPTTIQTWLELTEQ